MSDFLFDASQLKKQSSTRCKDCKHIQKWQYGGSFFFYCDKSKDSRTSNGMKKVKCKTPSCGQFEKK